MVTHQSQSSVTVFSQAIVIDHPPATLITTINQSIYRSIKRSTKYIRLTQSRPQFRQTCIIGAGCYC